MGFRSTFITEDWGILNWPEWFIEKYKHSITFNVDNNGAIASKHENKYYGHWSDLCGDIQKCINENKEVLENNLFPFILIWLHECGGIDKVQIYPDKIIYKHPINWELSLDISHYSCECREDN